MKIQKIKYLKNIIGKDKDRLISNFASLSFLQIVNFIFPLVLFPYLVRTLGIEKFGIVSLGQAIAMYFTILIDYGFNISATREIAIEKNTPNGTSFIFNSVFSTKLLLCIIGFILFSFIIHFSPPLKTEWVLYYCSFTIVVGQAIFPLWFFQGMEEMKSITYLNIASKLLFGILVFLFVRHPSDYNIVNLFLGIGNITASLVSLWIVRYKFNLIFKIANLSMITYQLKASWHIFISSIAINLSINSNLFILGLVAGPKAVGYYSIAEKIFLALRSIASILYQVVYPRVCVLATQSFNELLLFLKTTITVIFIIFIPCSLILFIFADNIIYYISGKSIPTSAFMLRIISFAPFIAALNIPACQTMLAYNLRKSYVAISTLGAIFNISLNILLASYFTGFGTAISALLTEIFITFFLYLYLYLYKPYYPILQVFNVFSKTLTNKI